MEVAISVGHGGTVSGGAYQRSILSKNPEVPVYARACPLWVTLAEQRQQQ